MNADTVQLVLGIILIIIGIGIIYWISRRKFNRRNEAGIEGFSSFEKSVLIRFIERVGKWIAYALIIVGLLFIWTYTQLKKMEEKESQKKVRTEQLSKP